MLLEVAAGAHRWMYGLREVLPTPEHTICPSWTGLQWAQAIVQETAVWPVDRGG